MLSRVQLFAIPWAVAHQASLPMGFSRREYWSGLPFPPPGDLPDPVIETVSPVSPAMAGRFLTNEPPGKPSLASWSNEKKKKKCPDRGKGGLMTWT